MTVHFAACIENGILCSVESKSIMQQGVICWFSFVESMRPDAARQPDPQCLSTHLGTEKVPNLLSGEIIKTGKDKL